MDLKAIKTLTAAALLASATAASAGTAPFNMVSGPVTPGVDVTLTIQESVMPGYDYDFVINNSSLMGIVTGVYFEVDWNSMLTNAGASSGPATFVTDNVSPQIADWEGSKSSHTVEIKRIRKLVGRHYVDTYYDNLDHGIQEGDQQVFSFSTGSDLISLDDIESMLGADGYGVAIRMQGLTEDEQVSGWGEVDDDSQEQLLVVQALSVVRQVNPDNEVKVTAAPSPTAALAGLAVFGIAGLRRRRK